jgi:diacylglycerol O-acyltransferase
MSTYPMDPVDAAWYHIDGPANLAMVTAVALTKQPLDFDRVREVYRLRLAGFDRFRQRVVETGFPLATPHWQDMPHFDIDQHLHRIALPAPHDMAALKVLCTDIASMPLDREQPLWHVHFVEDVGGGSAVIMRYHHCIGDGTAMQAVVRKVFDATPDAPLARRPRRRRPAARPADVLFGFDTLERAERSALALALGTVDAVAHPLRTLEKLDLVLGGTGVLLSELVKPADPKSPFKGDFGLRKHVAWSTPVAIADVKAIGAPLGATVNDVLVAAMTGALRAYLKGRGVDVNHTTVRAMVPVDLRPPERVGLLGNDFGLVLLDLPVAAAKAADRLAKTNARMDRLKRSPEPVAMKFLFELFGRGPKAIEDLATSIFGSKASLVMTNVVGPQDPVYLAGVPVDQMLFWVPHPGKEIGMGISILSYRGMASLTVIADAGLVPDPEAITDEFNREFGRMQRAAQRAPAAADAGAPPRTRGTTRTPRRREPARPAH